MSSQSPLDITRRVVLITGAANGIGRSLVAAIKKRKGTPVCIDLPSTQLDSLSELISNEGLIIPCDVTDSQGMKGAVDKTVSEFGKLDIVVANAGIERVGPTWTMSSDDFEEVLNVNVSGVYRTIKPALYQVIKNRGHIISTASIASISSCPLATAYGASKAAVDSMMRSLRSELYGTGSTAGAVYFGYIDSE